MFRFYIRDTKCHSFSHISTNLIHFSQGALGHDYVAKVEQHSSQTDAAKGFGGKFGVQKDRVDKVRNLLYPLFFTNPYLVIKL